MTSEPDFNWITFYSEFAKRLLGYKDMAERQQLITDIRKELSNIDSCKKLVQGDLKNLSDIDPFSILCLFNIHMEGSEKIRLERISIGNKLIKIIGLNSQFKLKDDFDFFGIPTLPLLSRSRYFFGYEDHNNSEYFNILWDLFEVASKLIDSEFNDKESVNDFINKFNFARDIKYNGSNQLSIGLFWAYPEHFPSLDSKTKKYIIDNMFTKKSDLKISQTFNGIKYLKIRKELIKIRDDNSHNFSSFADLSKLAWIAR